MRKNGNKRIEFICQKVTPDGNVCGTTDYNLSGTNTWVTLRKGRNGYPPIKVLKQRVICNSCGQFSDVHLDGTPLKDIYSDYEIKKLVNLTKLKQEEKQKQKCLEGVNESA